MKKSLFILCFFFLSLLNASATNYYISANGNDANNGTSTSTPWQTLGKLNSFFSSLKPGDNVYFNRGDVFYGRILITRSGSSGSPITISAYGTGANPVISGFTTVSAWTNLGSNIWESTSAISTLSYTNMVVINGVNTPMGRYPNSGYLIWQTHTGNVVGSPSTITSSSLSGTPNWAGAEVAFSTTTYIISRDKITAQSGGTLTYTTPNPADLFQNAPTYFIQSFIIQNDPRTLDTTNEWYYNPSTKKIRVYNNITPTNVQVATIDTLAYINSCSYINFNNISFQGANSSAIECNYNSQNITVQNCTFNYSGKNAIHGLYNSNLTGITIQNCTINNSNNNGIDIGTSSNATILQNTIKNTGMIRGMICAGGKTGIAIEAEGANVMIQNNTIDSVSYSGIRFLGSNTIIQNNYIKNFCLIQYDGGGVHTWNGPKAIYNGIKILNNIILNGNVLNHAVYLDESANGIQITGNTVYNCQRGIYLNNAYNVQILNNTAYSNTYGILMDKRDSTLPSNIVMKNNIFLAQTSVQRALWDLTSKLPSMPTPFTSDSNYYARPINDSLTIQTYLNSVFTQRTFAQWQALNGQDAHSHKSPVSITDTSKIVFFYNPTSSPITQPINYGLMNMDGSKNTTGSLSIPAWGSYVGIKNGTVTGNQPPTANAGPDQTITLPANAVTLTGSGTDPNGTIASYSWIKISGPSTFTITNAASATTTVTGLVQGIYQFQLKVIDNAGATGLDTVQITVNAASNLLPALNPANTVNGISYSYYESNTGYKIVPTFSTLTPVKTGTSSTFDISVANRDTLFSMNFTGYINVPSDGQYKFYTLSDDGSNLYIDNVLVVNNDGQHWNREDSGSIGLQAGKHAISVGYFQQLGGSILSVSYSGSGISKQVIPASVLFIVPGTVSLNNTNQTIISIPQVGINAYPNPFSDYITLNVTGDAGDFKLVLVNVSGQILWTKSGFKDAGSFQQSINTSTLQRGIYFLKVIQNNNTSSVIKLVK